MKKLIVLLTAIFLIVTSGLSQGIFQKDSLDKVIKENKNVSKKGIWNSLESNSPKELDSIQYSLVETEVRDKIGAMVSEILENYKSFSKNNSKRSHKKTFRIRLKDGPIKNEIARLLSEYRKWMREDGGNNYEEELDEDYIQSTTQSILAKHYIPTLCKGVADYSNEWLKDEEIDYVMFLRTKTVHTKVNDEKIMDDMSSEYLDENKEDIIKFLLYLSETHDIKKHYGTGDINIEIKNKYNLKYLETIKSLFHGAISSGDSKLKGNNKDKISEILYLKIQKSIISDIKYQMKISSEFK